MKHYRTISAIKHMARNLGISTRDFWSTEEEAILLQFYPTEGPGVYKRLPGRTRSQCRNHAQLFNLKINNREWSQEQLNILYKYYPKLGAAWCSNKLKSLGRDISKDSICSNARRFGIKYNGRGVIRVEDNKYFTIVDAAAEMNCSQGAILRAVKTGKASLNFHWRNVEETDCE